MFHHMGHFAAHGNAGAVVFLFIIILVIAAVRS
jgi:hypothetical protein